MNIAVTVGNLQHWVRDEASEEAIQFVTDPTQATNFPTLREALKSAQGIEDSGQVRKWEVVMDDVFTIRARVNA